MVSVGSESNLEWLSQKRSKLSDEKTEKQSPKIFFKAIKFITVYDAKKTFIFCLQQRQNLFFILQKCCTVYEVACPRCGKTYIGMTQRCLSVRSKEHATRLSSSAVGQHLS